MYCRHCGCKNSDNASYCRKCGEPLSGGRKMVNPSMHKGKIAIVVGASLVVIAAIVIASILILKPTGSGRSTNEKVAQDLTLVYQRLFSSGFTDSDLTSAAKEMLDMMPAEAVDAVLEEAGINDSSDVSELLSDYLSSSAYSDDISYLEKLSIECTCFVGDELSASELDSLNDEFQKAGINFRVSSGNKLGMNSKITVLEDFKGLSKGESRTRTVENLGLVAINIDGKWYLWIK